MQKVSKPITLNFRCALCGSLDIEFWNNECDNIIHPKCTFCGNKKMEVYDYRFRSEAHLRLEGDKIYWNLWLKGKHPTLPAPIGIYVKEPLHD